MLAPAFLAKASSPIFAHSQSLSLYITPFLYMYFNHTSYFSLIHTLAPPSFPFSFFHSFTYSHHHFYNARSFYRNICINIRRTIISSSCQIYCLSVCPVWVSCLYLLFLFVNHLRKHPHEINGTFTIEIYASGLFNDIDEHTANVSYTILYVFWIYEQCDENQSHYFLDVYTIKYYLL